jgi:hypothetical protein
MDMDFATACPLVRPCLPQIRFLFVGSRFRSTLPSDSPSRFCPCASLVLHLHQVVRGTFTPKLLGMPSTQAALRAPPSAASALTRTCHPTFVATMSSTAGCGWSSGKCRAKFFHGARFTRFVTAAHTLDDLTAPLRATALGKQAGTQEWPLPAKPRNTSGIAWRTNESRNAVSGQSGAPRLAFVVFEPIPSRNETCANRPGLKRPSPLIRHVTESHWISRGQHQQNDQSRSPKCATESEQA